MGYYSRFGIFLIKKPHELIENKHGDFEVVQYFLYFFRFPIKVNVDLAN